MRRLLTIFAMATAVAAAAVLVRDLHATGGFTPGDLVVYRVGDGSAALAAPATAVFLDEYTPGGTLVQSIPMPIAQSGNNRALTASGNSTTEGELTRSVDGQYLIAAGYNAALGASVATSTSATVNRVIARVDSNGSIDTTTALTDAISGGNPRGAVSTNGVDFWISGTSSQGGIRYATFGATSSTSLSTTVTNLRHAGIFGGQLYVSSASGAFRLAAVGTGLPTVTGQTITELPNIVTPTPTSPYGFFFADLSATVPGVDTVYIADDSASPVGGILKFSFSSATNTWVANGTVSSTTTTGVRGLTGTVTNGVVTLFITGTSGLATVTDSSGYNAANNGTLTTVATAGTNKAFRGVAFAPTAQAQTNPSGVGAAAPSSVLAGSPTLLTLNVTPGANPASSSIAVTANLSSIGGSAAQPFYDDGTNGDAVAGDKVFSFQTTVSGATSTGAKSIATTITDAQSRTGSATISLTVAAPTSLSGIGAASPATVQAGNATLLTVTVTPANSPASTGIAVNVDLSSIGGNAAQAFFDDGSHGDLATGNNVFSFSATIPPDAASGARTLPFTITDAQSRSISGGIGLTVNGSTPPSGTGSAVPPSVPAGGTTQLTVNVTPGTNPTSTGLSVFGDLSSIGGSNTQSFQSSGDTFSFSAAVDAATTPGPKTLAITVSDAQGRSSGVTIPVTVTAPLANSTIVISQIYPGGGNGTATYTNDFVQLYNRGNATVDITGWSLQYAAATGTGDWSGRQPLGGTIAPGQYYLIAMAGNGGGVTQLPPANVTSQINMGQSAGKIALADNGDLLTGAGGCPTSTHIKDLVGYGSTANCWEGTGPAAVPAALTTTALFRQSGGFIDTNDNKNDFFVKGPPAPLSTAPVVPLLPVVFTTYPNTNGVDIPRDATIEVTFTEAVTVDPAWFDIHCATTGAHNDATETLDGINRWITPNSNFVAGELCTVTVFKTKVHDADNSSPPQDYTWSFTVASGAAPPEPADVHLLMGNPTNAAADLNQPGNYLMSKPEYALSYNRDLGRPNWVSWHLTDAWIPASHPSRVDTFRPDPAVPSDWYRVQSFDFSGSGFDRGHMDPNADRVSSLPVNQATFLMSNMVAQSPDNNQGPWADFENYLRSVVHGDPTHLKEVYIVSGPVGTGGTGSNNGMTTTVAGGHVTVPAYTWKVALVLPDNGSEDDISRVTCSTTTIAVIMPNLQGIRTNAWQTYLTTVGAVETLTGYHFFTNLPQPIQNCIKAGTNGVNPKNDQAITFAPLTDQPFGFDVALQATASSGLAVTLAVTSGPATIVNGTTLHITGLGAVTIQATQAGDVNYNAAPPTSQSFNVTTGSQTITFDAPAPTPTYGDPAFQVSATGGPSGNPVTFAASGTCTASSQPGLATITIVSAGVCTVTASQAGSATYNAAPPVIEPIVIGKAAPSFTGLASPTIEAGTATTTIGGSIGIGVLIPTGAITVTLKGVTQTAAIQADGSFASAFATGLLTPAAAPYAIAYAYAGDSNFNSAGGVAAITVVDTTPPTIDVHADLTAEATSAGGASVTYSAPATHDAVSGDGVASCTPASNSTFAVGTTSVTCSASDANGNHASSAFTVTVADSTAPVLSVPSNLTREATGATTVVSYPAATAIDSVDPAPVVSCSPASGFAFVVGTTSVNCTATDAHNNFAHGAFTVTVTDSTAPVLSVPSNLTREATGATTVVSYPAATAIDSVDPAPVVSCSPASGSSFALGATTVSCTATDAHGNSASGTFTVTVTDTTAPALTLPANVTAEATGTTTTVNYTSATATDSVDPAPVVSCSPASGSSFALGATTVSCAATDAHGNSATGTFTVTVVDTTAPALTLPSNISIEAAGATTPVSYTATATDSVDGARAVTCLPASGFAFIVGTTTVNCSASDAHGNSATGTFTVTVNDTTAPALTLPSNISSEAAGATTPVSFTASATDTVDGVRPVTCVPASGSAFAVGTTAVTCTASDAHGNGAGGGFSVTVTDHTAPSLTVPASMNVHATSTAGAAVTFTPSASDLVDGARPVTCVPASGSTFAVGTTAVSCTTSDLHGNTTSAGFSVTVNPFVKNPKPPKVTAPKNMKVEATGPAGAIVTFAASATDPQDGTLPVVCAPAAGSLFPLGATTVTCSATNSFGKTDTDTAVITVRDTTDPTIVSLTPSVTVLPSTNLPVPVSIAAIVTDVVDAAPACQITKVTGGGNDLNNDGVIDWTITGPLSLNVEAVTRKHKDRTYTITVKCTDASGNASKEQTAVVISHP